ncbi:MAG: aminoglycoside N(3)-acetyltransferase [Actinobacteria bacterium]|nr:aminoglycoside N(3)-acetyltransferase [Actinomycetota bacterium]
MEPINRHTITEGLLGLGINNGDSLFVHSSFSSLGPVAGGPDTVIDALLETVGPKGNLVCPTFTNSFPGQNPPYHPLRTRSIVGIVSEFFRLRKGVRRSLHPTHSVAVLGPQAEQIISSHRPTDSPCGITSPFRQLYNLDAKVMFLGCGLGPNTTLHAVEDWAGLPYMAERTAEALIVDMDNNISTVSFAKEPGGHRDFGNPRSKIERVFQQEGIIKDTHIDRASVQLIGICDMVNVTIKALVKCPDILLCDSPDCDFCRQGKRELLKHKDNSIEGIMSLRRELRI